MPLSRYEDIGILILLWFIKVYFGFLSEFFAFCRFNYSLAGLFFNGVLFFGVCLLDMGTPDILFRVSMKFTFTGRLFQSWFKGIFRTFLVFAGLSFFFIWNFYGLIFFFRGDFLLFLDLMGLDFCFLTTFFAGIIFDAFSGLSYLS